MFIDSFRSGPSSPTAAAPDPGSANSGLAGSGSGRPRWRVLGSRLVREPLTHFLVLGVLIFIAAHVIEERSTRFRITIGPNELNRIVNTYVQQYGAEPNPVQVRTMLDNYVREEIYLREGLALGLDRNDEIVRRRVAQKYDFLQQDMAVPQEPSEPQLRQWYDAHKADFRTPVRRSFEQLYFAADKRSDAAAHAAAAAALAAVRAGQPAPAGDEFPGPKVIVELSPENVTRLFGGDEFARVVFAAKPGEWTGPFRSGFGWHLVRITQERPAADRTFDAAREDVRVAWREADRRGRNADGYRKLLARYTVLIDGAGR